MASDQPWSRMIIHYVSPRSPWTQNIIDGHLNARTTASGTLQDWDFWTILWPTAESFYASCLKTADAEIPWCAASVLGSEPWALIMICHGHEPIDVGFNDSTNGHGVFAHGSFARTANHRHEWHPLSSVAQSVPHSKSNGVLLKHEILMSCDFFFGPFSAADCWRVNFQTQTAWNGSSNATISGTCATLGVGRKVSILSKGNIYFYMWLKSREQHNSMNRFWLDVKLEGDDFGVFDTHDVVRVCLCFSFIEKSIMTHQLLISQMTDICLLQVQADLLWPTFASRHVAPLLVLRMNRSTHMATPMTNKPVV